MTSEPISDLFKNIEHLFADIEYLQLILKLK